MNEIYAQSAGTQNPKLPKLPLAFIGLAAYRAWIELTFVGSIESEMGDALAYIDINMGCPARKIVKKGDGSALMTTPELAAEIVRKVSAAVEHPTTVKFRKGYAADEDIAVDFARRMEDAGAAAVAVHGRTAAQFYSGCADWDVIARVKAAVEVPVIGNGDVTGGKEACALVAQTGCDAVMIGRGAQGNPWVFEQVRAALNGEAAPALPTPEQRVAMAHRHAELLSKRIGNNLVYMRKHVMWYLRGIPGASKARGELNQCVTLDDFDRSQCRKALNRHPLQEKSDGRQQQPCQLLYLAYASRMHSYSPSNPNFEYRLQSNCSDR